MAGRHGRVDEIANDASLPVGDRDAESARPPIDEVVRRLRDALGVRLVAYIANQTNTRPVNDWANEKDLPSNGEAARLRLALEVVNVLEARAGTSTLQSWMMGMNPLLGEEAPARLIRNNDAEVVGPHVVAAASDLVAGG